MTDDERFRVAAPYFLLGVFGFAVTLFTLLGMFAPALFVAILCGVVGAIGFAVYALPFRISIRVHGDRRTPRKPDDLSRTWGSIDAWIGRASASQRIDPPDVVVVPMEAEVADEVKEDVAEGGRIRKLEKPREL